MDLHQDCELPDVQRVHMDLLNPLDLLFPNTHSHPVVDLEVPVAEEDNMSILQGDNRRMAG